MFRTGPARLLPFATPGPGAPVYSSHDPTGLPYEDILLRCQALWGQGEPLTCAISRTEWKWHRMEFYIVRLHNNTIHYLDQHGQEIL